MLLATNITVGELWFLAALLTGVLVVAAIGLGLTVGKSKTVAGGIIVPLAFVICVVSLVPAALWADSLHDQYEREQAATHLRIAAELQRCYGNTQVRILPGQIFNDHANVVVSGHNATIYYRWTDNRLIPEDGGTKCGK